MVTKLKWQAARIVQSTRNCGVKVTWFTSVKQGDIATAIQIVQDGPWCSIKGCKTYDKAVDLGTVNTFKVAEQLALVWINSAMNRGR